MTMPPERSCFVRLGCCLALALTCATFSRGATAQDEEEALETDEISGEAEVPVAQATIDPSIIELGFPAELGALQRPAVAFKHAVHTEALNLDKEGCTKCHGFNDQGKLDPRLEQIDYTSGRDALTHQYHDLCIGCHTERSKQDLSGGPVTCGECHERRPATGSAPEPMPFDSSLHYRHIAGMEEKCEECHHVYNERTEQLKYVKGAEDACGTCHGDKDDGNNLSLRNAAHVHCVACHLDRQEEELDGGPVSCVGCHGLDSQRDIETLAEVPRLERGQKDRVWINALHAKAEMVPFDHEAHEARADFCTTCHSCTEREDGLASIVSRGKPLSCKECHAGNTRTTIERAFHLPSVDYSCIGCHERETEESDCAGCHSMPGHASDESACATCHSGPSAQLAWFAAASAPFPARNKLDTLLVHLREKQFTKGDFPESVTIGSLAEDYEPVEMPHRSIVVRLDSIVRNSKLAEHFHGETETLCSSCHHHSPVGSRPTPCGSCHGTQPEAAKDMPALEEAYHRQCIGCHQKMGLGMQGCTDCHAKAGQELGL